MVLAVFRWRAGPGGRQHNASRVSVQTRAAGRPCQVISAQAGAAARQARGMSGLVPLA
jgi:hypothetical protein